MGAQRKTKNLDHDNEGVGSDSNPRLPEYEEATAVIPASLEGRCNERVIKHVIARERFFWIVRMITEAHAVA
jgi:hypothetical protein